MKLTGNRRHRVSLTGKLILQLEYTKEHSRDVHGTGYYDDWTTTHWRDATAADLLVERKEDA